MKKRNRMKSLYWLILIVPLVLWWSVGTKAGIVRNATSSQNAHDSISVPFALLDTLGNPVAVDSAQDWGCMITYYPNGTEAVVDSFLLDATTNAQVRYNTARFRGLQTWYYRRQISDLDGTPVNGTYSYQFILRDSSLHMFTMYRGEFQIYQTQTFAQANDSSTVDRTSLSIYPGNFQAGAIDAAALAADAGTEIGLATWNTSFGTAFTGGSMGDSLNGMQYSKVSQLAVTNLDATVSSRSTLDSATTSRISRRMWGVQLGAAGSTDSLTIAQRLVDATRISGDATAADNAELFFDGTGYAGTNNVIPTVTTVTNLTNAPTSGDLTATMKTSVSAATWGASTAAYTGAGTFGNRSQRDSIRIKEIIDSLGTQLWASTAASGLDSAVVSRIARRMWGIQLGATGSTDSLTKAQRLAAIPVDDIVSDSVRKILGDSLATFGDSAVFARSVFDNDVVPLASRTVNTAQFGGTTVTGRDLGASVLISSGTGTGQLSVTSGVVSANATQISGDGTAADNLETMLDGTGGQTLTLEGLTITASSGPGMTVTGAANSNGVLITGGSSQPGLAVVGGSGAVGATIYGATGQSGLLLSSGASGGYALLMSGVDGAFTGEITTANLGTGAITENDVANGALRFGQEIDTVGNEQGINVISPAGTGLDSATTSRIIKRAAWGIGGGSSGSDSTTVAQRTATTSGTSGGPATSWIALVDAPGTTANRQFVIDSAAIGGKNEIGLTNIAIMVRDADAGMYTQRGIIERVNCVDATGLCTLQTSEAFLFDFEAGDSVFLKWDEPNYVFATLAEASAEMSDSVVTKDTTGLGGDPTVGGLIVSGGAAGADTSAFKTMLANNGYAAQKDSGLVLAETGTADGAIRRGEVPSTRAVAESVSVVVITEDSARYPRGGAIDTARNASGLSSGGTGGCPDSGGFAVTVVFLDSSDANEPVYDATVRTKSSMNGAITGKASTNIFGAFTFSMNAGKHYLFTQAYGMTFPVDSVTVAGNMTDTVFGYARARVPGMVTVFGRLTSSGGGTLAGASVELELTNYDDSLLYVDGGEQVVPVISRATVDADGDWAIPVRANSTFDAKSRYVLRIYHTEARFTPRLLHEVPDTTSINVKDLY